VVHAQPLGDFPQPGSAGGEETAQQLRKTLFSRMPRVIKKSTTEDEARITHLHTRNWPCSRVLRRHSGHAFPAILAAFSVVEKNPMSLHQ
jgi:hypothetical protein